jgi:hypothetical protein
MLKQLQKNLISDFYCKQRLRQLGNSSDDESIRAEEESAMVYRIVDHFCARHNNIFVKVAEDRGLMIENKVMSPEMAAAMFAEGNMGVFAARAVNRYLRSFFGRRIMPSEEKIFRCGLSVDSLPPVVLSKTFDDKTKLKYYVKPLHKVISLGIKAAIAQELSTAGVKSMSNIEMSWSADHGGGFFRAVVKCVLRFRDQLPKIQFIHRLGQMQCKNDKYDIIQATMGPMMNRGLCSMLEDDDRKTPKAIYIYKSCNSDIYTIITGDDAAFPSTNEQELVTTIPPSNISIAITVDLAFYATMLGNPKMD